ncbi:MAG: hypothetical protein HY736_17445 [Verrucomicrobia bacterium]|nr:hypothetical protein [Verrucomicrobiota bacterium]
MGLLGFRLADERRTRIRGVGRTRGLLGARPENVRAQHELGGANGNASGEEQAEKTADRPPEDAFPRPAATHLLMACIGVPVNDAVLLVGCNFVFLCHVG